MADEPTTPTQTIPGPALSATSDTPDFQVAPPPLSASGMDDPEPDAAPVETPAPDTTEPPVEVPADPPAEEEAPVEEAPAEEAPAAAATRKDSGVGKVLNAKDTEIARLNAEKDALQRQFNEAVLKREPVEPVAPPVEVKPDLRPVRPKQSQFETPEAYDTAMDTYEDARDAWVTRQSEAKATAILNADRAIQDQQATTAKVTQDFAAVETAHMARITKAAEKHADFAAVAFANDVAISPSMGVLIMQSDVGPDLMYALGKDKAEATRIASMVIPGQFYPKGHEWAGQPIPNVALQAQALGRLEGRIAAQAPPAAAEVKPTPKQVSKAPAPVQAVRTRGTAAVKSREEMTAEEIFDSHPTTQRIKAARAAMGMTTH